MTHSLKRIAGLVACAVLGVAFAAQASPQAVNAPRKARQTNPARVDERINKLEHEVEDLKALVLKLQAQVAPPGNPGPTSSGTPVVATVTPAPPAAAPPPGTPATGAAVPGAVASGPVAPGTAAGVNSPPPASAAANAPSAAAPVIADLLRGVTVNGMLDAYYEYNTNDPIGRVNYLRAYDVSSNSFSLSQADLMVESAPDLASGKREGMRIDLQFGQATSDPAGQPSQRAAAGCLSQHFPGLWHLHLSGGQRTHRRLRQVGKLVGNRGQLHQGPAELFALILVRLSALLSHGGAREVRHQRRGRGQSVDHQRNGSNRGFQQLQGPDPRTGDHADIEPLVDDSTSTTDRSTPMSSTFNRRPGPDHAPEPAGHLHPADNEPPDGQTRHLRQLCDLASDESPDTRGRGRLC